MTVPVGSGDSTNPVRTCGGEVTVSQHSPVSGEGLVAPSWKRAAADLEAPHGPHERDVGRVVRSHGLVRDQQQTIWARSEPPESNAVDESGGVFACAARRHGASNVDRDSNPVNYRECTVVSAKPNDLARRLANAFRAAYTAQPTVREGLSIAGSFLPSNLKMLGSAVQVRPCPP